jgi:hypothetical protein
METVALHGPRLGVASLCAALALPRATYYRHLEAQMPAPRPTPARALSAAERQDVLALLHEPRFMDVAPAEVHARLLDEGRYLCSERTMYRVLAENAEEGVVFSRLGSPCRRRAELCPILDDSVTWQPHVGRDRAWKPRPWRHMHQPRCRDGGQRTARRMRRPEAL